MSLHLDLDEGNGPGKAGCPLAKRHFEAACLLKLEVNHTH